MTVYVFTGPTISPQDARRICDATYLPPVEHGDVYRAARRRPDAIAIVDGYFERVPAVWHKEILFALTEGIPVFGSSSMGALRAAELAPFGMVGIGLVFESFQRGVLEDDDEVAVVHGSAADGHRKLSEAMVDIRFTLDRAVAESVVGPSTAAALVALGKARFYADRSWPTLLADAREAQLPGHELEALAAWLPDGQVDQKRRDAEQLLRLLGSGEAGDVPRVRYRVEHTVFWDHLVRYSGAGLELGWVLDELRLEGEPYRAAFRGALVRHLTLTEARSVTPAPTAAEVRAALARLRAGHGLLDDADVARWSEANDLTVDQLQALACDEVLVARGHQLVAAGAVESLPDHLRVTGRWSDLVRRARHKQQALVALGADNPGLADAGMSIVELCRWHAARIGELAPADDDGVTRYAEGIGFTSVEELTRALVREYLFVQAEPA